MVAFFKPNSIRIHIRSSKHYSLTSDDDHDRDYGDDGDGQQPGREASRRQKPGVRQKPKFDFIFQNNDIRFLFEILSPIGVKVKNFL